MTNLRKVLTLTLAGVGLLLMIACNTNKEAGNTTVKDNATVTDKTKKTTIEAATPLGDCMSDRKTVNTHENVDGKILKLNEKLYVISINADDTKRYKACNLDNKWQQDGMKVVFSGLEKEIKPNERWPGTPLRLTAISAKK